MYSLDWPYVHGKPLSTALFKEVAEDFHVNELFEGEFSGEGEHIVIKIEKRGINTEDVIKSLARLINKPVKLISYAGLKDRQALATQWLSIHAPGEVIEGIGELSGTGWRVIEHNRHNKKLRPGFLSGNHFMIRLKEVSDVADFEQRIAKIRQTGVPNYFGLQRFGRDGGNLVKANEVLTQGRRVKDRFLMGMYYSAARSWIFNQILALRVTSQNWNTPLIGDVMQLSGSNSIFTVDALDEELNRRIQEQDIAPASPLAGKSKNKVSGDALQLINQIYSTCQPWIEGLEKQGLEEAWRANILYPKNLDYQISGNNLELSFCLPAGCFATIVLRELVNCL